MQLNNHKFAGVRSGLKFHSLTVAVVFLGLSLLVSACGDNTATTVPTTAASTTAPASTTAVATTASATTVAATTAVVTTAAATTPAAATTGSATTAPASTTASATTAATTATGTTAPATTAVASTGSAKLSLDNLTAQAGTTIQVKGEGYPANTWVTIEFGPGTTTRQVASLALVDSTGKFNSPLMLRAYGDGSDIEPGANLIKATTQDGSVTANLTFTITPAPATSTPNS